MTESPFGQTATSTAGRLRGAAIGVVLLGATVFGAWWFTRGPAEATGPDEQAHEAVAGGDSLRSVAMTDADQRRIGVTFATVTEAPLAQEVRAVTQVVADESRLSIVTLKVDGFVEQLFVDRTGVWVAHGDPLFTLYSPMLVSAQAEYLVARGLGDSVASGQRTASAGAAGLQEAARRRLRYWDVPEELLGTLDATGVPQRTVTFASPTHGIVIEKLVVAGQRVMAGEPLYRIADLSTVWLEGDVFEQDLPVIGLGLTASVELEALPGESLSGRVVYIAPTLDPATRTARVRVELPNRGLRLKPGMYGTMRLRAAARTVLTIPRSAILLTGDRAVVFVRAPDGMLVPREVQLGLSTGDRTEVRAGLRAGEVVVASATFLIDAESNLGSALGGMAGMPGMEPVAPPARKTVPDTGGDHSTMPGMGTDSITRKAGGGGDAHPNH
jgi:Cu(I)/Ag(I) efflux system membrane fusion protein